MPLESFIQLAKLRRNLSLSRDELAALQRKKLMSLLDHAYRNVTYYRRLFDSAGIRPGDISCAEDLRMLPTTGKLTLQAIPPGDILAGGEAPADGRMDVTSGSTGIPLHVCFNRRDYMIRSLIFIRTFMESGYRLTDRQAVVTDTRFVSSGKYWFQKLGIFRKKYIPVQDELDRQIAMLCDYKPDYIHGYPLSLARIGEEIIRRGMDEISPRMVCTGAELVSRKTRDTINKAFGVDMRDTYATIESGLIAWECREHRGYHINLDSVVLEFLTDDGPARPGERGRTVITNLHSYAMPVIRYELGDVCVPSDESCPCGSSLPLMSIVEGRVDDMITTPSGKLVSPNSITNAMEAVAGISRFRVVQKTMSLLSVFIVEGKGFSSETPGAVEAVLRELVGDRIKIEVRIVDDIPSDLTGKIRAVISEVSAGRGPSRENTDEAAG